MATTATSPPQTAPLGVTRGKAVLVAAVLGTALAYMSDDMLNLAIPSVARDLGATVSDAQWVLGAYYVALVACVLVIGSIGDIVGHRRVFIAGLGLFSAGALVCAAAPAVVVLVAGRFVQGIGAAALLAAGLALVTSLSPPAERSRSVGMFLGLVAAVPALGPVISGTLVDQLSWRWLFIVPLVLPATALVVTLLLVPETRPAADRQPDVPGASLAFLALAALSVGLISGANGADGLLPLVGVIVAVAAAIGFVVVERRVADPLFPLRFLRRRTFVAGNAIWLLATMASWAAVFFVAIGVQTMLGQPALVAGLSLIPIYLIMMIGSPLAGRLADRVGPGRPIVAGLVIYAAGLVLLSRLGPGSALVPDVAVGIVVLAVGMAAFSAPVASATLGALDQADQGVASGVNNAMGQLAGLLGVVLVPMAVGLGGVAFGSDAFAAGASRALQLMAAVVVGCVAIAVVTFMPRHATQRGTRATVGPGAIARDDPNESAEVSA